MSRAITLAVSSPAVPIYRDGSALRGLLLPTISFLCALAGMFACGLHETDGRFVYPLDDTYIHMAIARTLAEHGVWGIDAREFVSGSSSMAWTAVLAVWFKLGGGDLGPLLINIPLALGTLFACNRIGLRYGLSAHLRLIATLAVLLVTPLPVMAAMGMEHCLQVLVFILFLASASHYLATKEKWLITLALLALMTAVRFEGIFAATAFGLLLLLRRDWAATVIAGATAAAPILLFGAYSMWNGAYPVPNSILLKAGLVTPADGVLLVTLGKVVPKLLGCGVIVAAAIVAVVVLRNSVRDERWHFAALWLGTALLHTLLAPFGWLFRYEAYLVASGVLLIGLNFGLMRALHEGMIRKPKLRMVVYLGAALLAGEAVSRVVAAHWVGTAAMRDRYYENVASAEFIKQHYDGQAVLMNDIGAVAHLSDAKVLDLFGLGSNQPIAFQRSGNGYDASDVERWARHEQAKVALVKVEWSAIRALVPPGWKRVATWHLPRNLVFNDHELAFFASDEESAQDLAQKMREFSKTMPPEVRVTFER